MKKKDRIKTIVALVIISSVLISFVFIGKDESITRWLAVSGIAVWLLTMFLTNKKNKN